MADDRNPRESSSIDDVPFVILLDESGARPRAIAASDLATASGARAPVGRESRVAPSAPDDSLLREAEAAIDRELEDELQYEALEGARRLSALRVCQAVALVCAVALPVLLVVGWPYYSLAHASRPFHRFHEILRPSGTVGLSLGLLGTALIGASLGYPIRKLLAKRGRAWATVRTWMRLHVLMGLLGPALIAFHTGFVVTSALGFVAFSAMAVIVLSGLTGRYLLVNLRAVESGEIDSAGLRQRLEVYTKKLVDLGLPPDLLMHSELPEPRSGGLKEGLRRVFIGDREGRAELRRLKDAVRSHGGLGHEAKLILVLARRLCRERQVLIRTSEIRNLVGAWRFLHRWLTVVLVTGALFHIGVALRFGELWIFGGGR